MTQSNASFPEIAPLVLVVDDDPTMRILLKAALEEDRYQVAVANNGEQGLSNYLNLCPDMVLLDAMMGAMSGFELCGQIRKHPLGQNIPILMLTSLDDQASIDQAFAVGATDYVTKPIHWGVLSKRVQRLFEQAQILQTQNDCAEEMSQIRAWSSVLEALVRAQAEQASILKTVESLLPNIQAFFSIDSAFLLLPPNDPLLALLQGHSFVRTGTIFPENLTIDANAVLHRCPEEWAAIAKIETDKNCSAAWVAGRSTASRPWSASHQRHWDLLALIVHQGLASVMERTSQIKQK